MFTPGEWSHLNDLFHRACQLPLEERDAFARAEAGSQPHLLDELRRMLAVEADATQAVRAPLRDIGTRLSAELPEPEPGTRFGPWELDRLIGKGGMGQVYLGHRADGAYARQVAIKLIGSKGRSTRQRDHFERERQLLARMQHPAIAQIHDAGSDEHGRLYLVMEYVDGLPLTQWCRQQKPSLRERVRLLTRIADGVQHAHQKGVVHRDLKPGNILIAEIDGVATPRIIDFGIASQADEGAGEDNRPEPAGTPGYMSPEQTISGMDVDSRSDVYALGAILFELVSGKRPHGTTATGEGSSTGEPLRPSDRIDTLSPEEIAQLAQALRIPARRLRRTLRDDLDWIVARATQPDREQRYPSAAAFADDLRRWLDGYPLQAAPRRRLWLLRKFVARNRLAVAAFAALALAVAGGLVATTWALHRAEQAVAREQASNRFLSDVLTSVDPSISFDLDQTLMRRVLDQASERIRTDLAEHPQARVEIETTLAYTYQNLGDPERARTHLESALETATAALGRNALPTQIAVMELANNLTHGADPKRAEALLRDNLPSAWKLSDQDPILAPRMQSRLGWNLHRQGRQDEALPLLQHSHQTLLERVGPDHQRTIDAGQYLAAGVAQNSRLPEAIAMMQDLVQRQIRLRGEDHPQTMALRNSLAAFHGENSDFAAAEIEYRALIDALTGQHGTSSQMLPILQFNLATTLHKSGVPEKIEAAGPYFVSALDAQLERQGPDAANSITMRRVRANWLADTGRNEQARDEYQATLTSARTTFGEAHPQIAILLEGLARQELALDNTEAALAHAQDALVRMQAMPDTPAEQITALRELLNTIRNTAQASP